MSEQNLPEYVAEIERRGLRFLEGYPSTLFVLARHILESGRGPLPMKAVFTSSETLHATQAEAITAAFAAPVFDYYGLAERVIFASQCEAGEKHLAEEYGWTEVVDGEGNAVADGQLGFLVGTSIHNTAMPMLRYRTGDLSCILPGTCTCGRTSRRIRAVTTKAEDIVLTPDGVLISPSVLTHPFKPFPQILKSQVIQESLNKVTVLVVPSGDFTEAHQAELVAGLTARLGPAMDISVRRVNEIPNEPSGKFRWVISRLAHSTALDWSSPVS